MTRQITAEELLALARLYTIKGDHQRASKYQQEEYDLQVSMNRN